jgi:Ala-tRNA(Pro) deacylase
MSDIYRILQALDISYEKHTHPPLFTVADTRKYNLKISGGHTKNLFLRNKKEDTYYLAIVEASKRVDLKKLGLLLQEAKLSFASPEKLQKHLGLTPGAVSALGLVNDTQSIVRVVVDNDLFTYETINCHPNTNTQTLQIPASDFRRFLEHTQNTIQYLDIPQKKT